MPRDSGCSNVVVRRHLVPDEKLKEATTKLYLLDRAIRHLPEVEVYVNTPYFTGFVVVKVIDNAINDLVLGNIDGVRRTEDPDKATNREMALEGRDVRKPNTGNRLN